MSQGSKKSGKKSGEIFLRQNCRNFFFVGNIVLCVLDHIFWEDAMSNLQRVDRLLSVKDIKANPRNARTHSKAQIGQISDSIKACGFGAPVLVDETLTLIAGHGRFKAAEFLGMQEIPAVQRSEEHTSELQSQSNLVCRLLLEKKK